MIFGNGDKNGFLESKEKKKKTGTRDGADRINYAGYFCRR
jgi:hypothetical protein